MVKKGNWRRFFGKSFYDNLPVDKISKVDLFHYRKLDKEGNILARGGRTICSITIGEVEFTGVAKCMDIDNFEKREGRKRAKKYACLKYWENQKKLNRIHATSIGLDFKDKI